MLKKVTFNDMKEFINKQNPTYSKEYVENTAKELIQTLDEKLDEVIYTYCISGQMKDFHHTNNGETFSLYEIKAMRSCNYYEAILLMDGFIKDAKEGRRSIMRR